MVFRLYLLIVLSLSLSGSGAAVASGNSTSSETVNIYWLGQAPTHNTGTTFGLPWAKGRFPADSTKFTIAGDGESVPLQSWTTAYWPDGSIKWTGHAIPATDSSTASIPGNYTLQASSSPLGINSTQANSTALRVTDSADDITVNTGKLTVSFPKSGSALVASLKTTAGKVIGQNGKLVLHSQTSLAHDVDDRASTPVEHLNFESSIDQVSVGQESSVRALVTVNGTHTPLDGGSTHAAWLPFVVRFYLYANSDAVRVVHSIVFNGNATADFITGLGIRFEVPLAGEELYNRHIRLSGVDGGLLNEAVQGITGLRRDPGTAVKAAQVQGRETPPIGEWATTVSGALQWVPTWGDYSLSQLSSDGFNLQKRTKAGQGWVKIPGGTRAGGTAYLGGATVGGLAVGLRNFWKRYPTGIDIRDATTDTGSITMWLYSPSAPPLDLRPYHDGLGQTGYADETRALDITYEDWQKDFDTPYGIARTSELFLYGFDSTPTNATLASLDAHKENPPALLTAPETYQQSGAIGTYWSTPGANTSNPSTAATIESHLDFLVDFYQRQVEDRRWYGFLDHGDIMHTYDLDRHTWRYDVGGYAWDNSELSPDLFFWLYFLRTGREDVYRFAEAHLRHTSEVDVYHLGQWKGLGTRHGVLHFEDSAKQARISQPQYRKYFYYLSGGDERVGELLSETLDADQTFITLDPNRKVRTDGYTPTPTAVSVGLGTDYSSLLASWLLEWERRGPRAAEARHKINATTSGIAALRNGFVSGSAMYNPQTGALAPPYADPGNNGTVAVSHLNAVFGLPEAIADLTAHWGAENLPAGFAQAWLDYCYYYGATDAEQAARYGTAFGDTALKMAHSRLAAFAAAEMGNASVAARAWNEFTTDTTTDALLPSAAWSSRVLNGSIVLAPVEEAAFIVATNAVAQYGLAAIQNLAYVGEELP
ncbi:unnamed protein product [Discula destructiva]